jgi:hypothetical protein
VGGTADENDKLPGGGGGSQLGQKVSPSLVTHRLVGKSPEGWRQCGHQAPTMPLTVLAQPPFGTIR